MKKSIFVLSMCLMLLLSACGKTGANDAAEVSASISDAANESLENGGSIADVMDAIDEAAENAANSDVVYEEPKTVDESSFEYTEGENGIIITGYAGEETSIVVPEKIGDKTVTEIGESAFIKSAITAVELPASVTKIGSSAFYYCTALVDVSMPGVTEICEAAFQGCMLLRNVKLPDGLVSMEPFAFAQCTSIKSITVPASLTELRKAVFMSSGLEELTVPGTVDKIRRDSFNDCDSLKSVVVLDGVESISEDAFSYCDQLESITIPASVTELNEMFAWGCSDKLTIRTTAGSAAEQVANSLGFNCVTE